MFYRIIRKYWICLEPGTSSRTGSENQGVPQVFARFAGRKETGTPWRYLSFHPCTFPASYQCDNVYILEIRKKHHRSSQLFWFQSWDLPDTENTKLGSIILSFCAQRFPGSCPDNLSQTIQFVADLKLYRTFWEYRTHQGPE